MPRETLLIEVFDETEFFADLLSDVFMIFIICTAFVNQRYLSWVDKPVVKFVFL